MTINVNNLLSNERSLKCNERQYMYIDIVRVNNNWREERGSSDTLRRVVKMRENNAWKEREKEREGGKTESLV